eukprot:TRINITY_DN15399_c0_g1_i1.p1 TRINITY_DN15399_c0_g1~~TRINITY_DN15399_c0_g1_i1.p1  ORF type:complete len:965 (-),score=164.25 TRINITY_DN15399_c0_g1_i1:56-2950(-)
MTNTALIVFPSAAGHVNPSLPLCARLVKLGWRVEYLSIVTFQSAIESTGATFHDRNAVLSELGIQDVTSAIMNTFLQYGDDKAKQWALNFGSIATELLLPPYIEFFRRVAPKVIVYCPVLCQVSHFAAMHLRIPDVSLLTAAGPGFWDAAFAAHGGCAADLVSAIKANEANNKAIDGIRKMLSMPNLTLNTAEPLIHEYYTNVNIVSTIPSLADRLNDRDAGFYKDAGKQFEFFGPILGETAVTMATPLNDDEKASLFKTVREAIAANRRVIYISMGTVITGEDSEHGWAGTSGSAISKSSRVAAQDDYVFWTSLGVFLQDNAEKSVDGLQGTFTKLDMEKSLVATLAIVKQNERRRLRSRLHHFRHSAPFDTSPQHIDTMFDLFLFEAGGRLFEEELRERLAADCQLPLSREQLSEALKRVRARCPDDNANIGGGVSRVVFASLWQRLILGLLCCQKSADEAEAARQSETGTMEPEIRLIEYSEHDELSDRLVSEPNFLFGCRGERARPQLDGGGFRCQRVNVNPSLSQRTRWAWIETSRSELLMKMGAKFFLHPVATEDLIHAAREGKTKIDRYRHQYFVALEVYALTSSASSTSSSSTARPGAVAASVSAGSVTSTTSENETERRGNGLTDHEMEVGPRIFRSTLSLLATGNPPTATRPASSRDWLLTVINDVGQERGSADRDPLDRFESDQGAARKVLQNVRDDLGSFKRQREYQADFLLYSIIDRAAGELTPIYNAYGRRLRWLQDRLDAGELSSPKTYADEVTNARIELVELRQWVGQIKGIVHHLETDCRSEDGDDYDANWNFGAAGKGTLVFLRHTQDYLEQALDRLAVLDDLAKAFLAATERDKSDFMNSTLFMLTVATAVFLPAQFLAGVYGMNFVDSEGRPAITELTLEYGYLGFWVVVGTMISTGLCLVFSCYACSCRRLGMRCRSSLCCGRRSRREQQPRRDGARRFGATK